ncbi:hypothetical protein Rsub_09075 [Raphidocelis subcapitata]|uniref:Uncharacterized protein n=1 Tax=Raphidocelis subcapitata TaxID=307507 RepID=A0A2V0PEG1_9CHLO|nr:hypothetical protein Rsub_09075 [Raphidocelis subcapitata]|eukprot:GBF96280.1 hypothetical protein Rsub_09075 [Raphidocelis subcapitata]
MSKKPSPKAKAEALAQLSQLKAFEAVFRSSCQLQGAPPYRPLVRAVQEAIADGGATRVETVALEGPSVDAAVVRAVAEALAGYGGARRLLLTGCRLGDGGLAAVAALLRASGGPWWRGARLEALEIRETAEEGPPSQPPAAAGAAPAPGAAGLSAPATADGSAASGGGGSGSGGGGDAAVAAATAEGAAGPQRDSTAPPRASGSIASSTGGGKAASPDAAAFPIQLCIAAAAVRDRSPGPGELPPAVGRLRTPLQLRGTCMRAALLAAGHGCPQQQPQQQPQPQQPQQQQQQQVPQHPRPCFGGTAIKDLALALGVTALPLTTLVLDFTRLGDEAAELLAPGLQRCGALKVLSLRGCGLGAAGARAIAVALTPPLAVAHNGSAGSGAAAAAGHHSRFRPPALTLGIGAADGAAGAAAAEGAEAAGPWRGPALTSLSLSHNPGIGGLGLLSINAMLRHSPSLEALGLADVGLTGDDAIALSGLASALLAGCPAIAELDLRFNQLGDRGVSLLLPLPPARPTLVALRVTAHIGRGLARQLVTLLAANAPARAKKGGKGKGKSKGKAAAARAPR